MGYDTSSYIVQKEEVAYLRRNMFGWEDMLQLYEALGIEGKFQRISGHGDELFSSERIEEAANKLEEAGAEADMVAFLRQTLEKSNENEILISFY